MMRTDISRWLVTNYSLRIGALIWVMIFMSSFTDHIIGQDKAKSRIKVTCSQLPDNKIMLEAKLLGRIDKRYKPVSNAEVLFYITQNGDETELGKTVTNKKGLGAINIDNTDKYVVDEDGYLNFFVEYEGNDQFKSASGESAIMRAVLLYDIVSEETENKIMITAISADTAALPLAEFEIKLSVPRMYSDLVIGEEYTDDEGKAEFIVPSGIPGDNQGNLDLKIEVLDTDDHGNLMTNLNKTWGVPKEEVIESNRQLWTPNAPLWMVATFAVLMIAVWSHFGIAIYNLIRLKNLGKD